MHELNLENGEKFAIYEAKPNGNIKGGIILIHEVWGLLNHIKDVADRYANEGYLVIAPELILNEDFSDEEIEHLQECIFDPEKRNSVQTELRRLMDPIYTPEFTDKTLNKLKVVFQHLWNNPEVRQNIGVIGFCFEGTYSYLFPTIEPRIKLAIPYYGRSASLTHEQISNIHCPIRAFYGENDKGLVDDLDDLKNKMKISGVDYSAIVYPNCAHAFFNDTNSYAYNEFAAKDSFEKVKEYLNEYLA